MIPLNSALKKQTTAIFLLNMALISSTQAMLQEDYKSQRQMTLGHHDYDIMDNENKQYLCPTASAARDFYDKSRAEQISSEELQDIMIEIFGRSHPVKHSLISNLWRTHAQLHKQAGYEHIKEEEGTLAALLNRYNRQDSDIKKENILYLHLNAIQDITSAILHQDYNTFNPIIEKGDKKRKNYALLQTHMTLLKENAHDLPFSESPIFQNYLRWYEGNLQFFNGDSLDDRLQVDCTIRLEPKGVGIICNQEKLYFTLKTVDNKLTPQKKIKGLDKEVFHRVKKFIKEEVGDLSSITQDDTNSLLYAISTQLDCGNTLFNKSYVLDVRLTSPCGRNTLIHKNKNDFWGSLMPVPHDKNANKRPSLDDIRSVIDKHEESSFLHSPHAETLEENRLLINQEISLADPKAVLEKKLSQENRSPVKTEKPLNDDKILNTEYFMLGIEQENRGLPHLATISYNLAFDEKEKKKVNTDSRNSSHAKAEKQKKDHKRPVSTDKGHKKTKKTTLETAATAIKTAEKMKVVQSLPMVTSTAIAPPTPSLTIQTNKEVGIGHFKTALELVKKGQPEAAVVFFRYAADRGVYGLPSNSTKAKISENALTSGNRSPSLPESDQNSHTSKPKETKHKLDLLNPFSKKKK